MGFGLLWKFVPATFKENLRDWVRRTAQTSPSQLLAKLYEPLPLSGNGDIVFFDSQAFAKTNTETYVRNIPVPTRALRKGYGETPVEFLEQARSTASMLRTIMAERNIALTAGTSVLDWGCATGRVLEQFQEEAAKCEFWGADIDAAAIAWAKQHFSPPFRFLTCTLYPHLPFEDHKFSFIYCGSVFTHIRYLEDSWLLELNRILRPGGVIVLTVLDEHTIEWFRENYVGPRRIPRNFDLAQLTSHDQVYFAGDDWASELSFFKTDWIRKTWGQYFDIADVKPRAEGYQTAVVLAKRRSNKQQPAEYQTRSASPEL